MSRARRRWTERDAAQEAGRFVAEQVRSRRVHKPNAEAQPLPSLREQLIRSGLVTPTNQPAPQGAHAAQTVPVNRSEER